jgi:hypothetical protein
MFQSLGSRDVLGKWHKSAVANKHQSAAKMGFLSLGSPAGGVPFGQGRKDGISIAEKGKEESQHLCGEQALAEVRRCLALTVAAAVVEQRKSTTSKMVFLTVGIPVTAWGGDEGGKSQCGGGGRSGEESEQMQFLCGGNGDSW